MNLSNLALTSGFDVIHPCLSNPIKVYNMDIKEKDLCLTCQRGVLSW